MEPEKYNRGMLSGFRTVVKEEGAGALLTGFGPTVGGYFLQGALKFGGNIRYCVIYMKIAIRNYL